MTALRLCHRHLPGIIVIVIDGDHDATNHEQLHDSLVQLRHGAADHVAFDLSAVPFLDSCDLRVLLNTHIAAAHHGGGVHLAAATARLSRILEITGVVDLRHRRASAASRAHRTLQLNEAGGPQWCRPPPSARRRRQADV